MAEKSVERHQREEGLYLQVETVIGPPVSEELERLADDLDVPVPDLLMTLMGSIVADGYVRRNYGRIQEVLEAQREAGLLDAPGDEDAD